MLRNALWLVIYVVVAAAIIYPLCGCGTHKGEGWAANFMCLGLCTTQEAQIERDSNTKPKNGPEQNRGNDNAGQE